MQELRRAQCRVKADIVQIPEQFTKRLDSKCYDLILGKHLVVNVGEMHAAGHLQQNGRRTPLIMLTGPIQRETVEELSGFVEWPKPCP